MQEILSRRTVTSKTFDQQQADLTGVDRGYHDKVLKG